MRVGVNARLLHSSDLRSVNRYTINLLCGLAGLGHELFLYTDQPIHADHLARLPEGSYQVRIAPPKSYTIWEQRWLPKQCKLDRVDVLHTPFHFGLPYWCPCPRIATWHDTPEDPAAQPKQGLTEQWRNGRLMTRFHHWVARTRSEAILTVSEHVRDDLVRLLHIPQEKIQVIPEAADPHFTQTIAGYQKLQIRRKHDLPNPYFFYVGGWEQRKNLPFLIRAFASAELEDVDLVIAGGHPYAKHELERFADELGVADNVQLLNWIDEADLPTLYAAALAFVYASDQEGFCLQLCEAMNMGCATLAADVNCLAEVLGDGGVKFGLDHAAKLGELMRRIFYDEWFRAELQDRARKRAAEFSWEQTARATAEVYEALRTGKQLPIQSTPAKNEPLKPSTEVKPSSESQIPAKDETPVPVPEPVPQPEIDSTAESVELIPSRPEPAVEPEPKIDSTAESVELIPSRPEPAVEPEPEIDSAAETVELIPSRPEPAIEPEPAIDSMAETVELIPSRPEPAVEPEAVASPQEPPAPASPSEAAVQAETAPHGTELTANAEVPAASREPDADKTVQAPEPVVPQQEPELVVRAEEPKALGNLEMPEQAASKPEV